MLRFRKIPVCTLVILLLILHVFFNLNAQTVFGGFDAQNAYQRFEIGIFAGSTNYQGDLDRPHLMSFSESNMAFGGLLRFHVTDQFSARVNLLLGKISGDDANYEFPAWRKARGFSFTAPVVETTGQIEFEPLGKRRYRMMRHGVFKRILSPYVFVGLGFTSVKPDTYWNDENPVADPVLIAKDRAGDYPTTHMVIPIGAGLKFDVSRFITLSLEVGQRNPFTDYLDGVSMSASPKNGDWYIFTGVVMTYRIQPKRHSMQKCPSFKKKKW